MFIRAFHSTTTRQMAPLHKASSYNHFKMNQYLAFQGQLAKKDSPTKDRISPEMHSPSRDNRKFDIQG
ncbi:hypothetical protein CDAR_252841 [Caerostris darwini]|uniref:Uncharacterized protein n=1 Tax=Caerostris darwini TaxID=1538125 RepID=A0AAV4Q798_9ARAC|nr:hypothetical protein CDAR_252841 [Caerostris darwini]